MSLVWGSLIVIAVAAAAVAAMLFVRRRAPEGSYFEDGDRAAGVFGVLATGFAILAGFIVVLAFQSFDDSRTGAETEARVVAHQFETVQFLPSPAASGWRGSSSATRATSCTRNGRKWRTGRSGPGRTRGASRCFARLRTVVPRSASEQAAYAKYLDERSDREDARADRTHSSEGVIPAPLWIVLFLSAAILFVFMLLFADSGEPAFVQATMIGGVAILVTSLLLLLWFLDNPYQGGVGSLKPTAMQSTLDLMRKEASIVGGVDPPCDAAGSPS
jgi:hypothetical protein